MRHVRQTYKTCGSATDKYTSLEGFRACPSCLKKHGDAQRNQYGWGLTVQEKIK